MPPDEHDRHAGKIFKASEAVGEPLGGPAAGQGKGHPQRQRRGGIAEIMNSVGQEGHAPRERDDDQLKAGGDEQAHTRPLEGPHAARGGDDGRIGYAMKMAMAGVCVWMRRSVSMLMHHGSSP
jgi:hypothetical protein